MDPVTDVAVAALMEFIRLIITKHFLDVFLTNRKTKWTYAVFLFSYLLTISSYLFFHTVIINISASFIGIWILTLTYFGSHKKRLLLTAMILAVSSVLDVISVFLLEQNPTGSHYDIISSFISVGLFFISSMVTEKISESRKDSELTGHWWYLLIIELSSIVTLFVLSMDKQVSRKTFLFVGLVILLWDFMVYNLYHAMMEKYVSEQENMMLREQVRIYENQMKLNMENERKIHSLRHDMKHHLKEITNLAQHSRTDDIICYIRDMADFADAQNGGVVTGNNAVDGILNYKILEAKRAGIEVHAHLTVPDMVPLSSFDMTVIFGNIMDNAIEAVYGMDHAYIDIHVKYSKGCLFIKASNPYYQKILYDKEEKIISAKHDQSGHGYGLGNIRKIVEKYHGDFSVDTENGIFTIECILFMKEPKSMNYVD